MEIYNVVHIYLDTLFGKIIIDGDQVEIIYSDEVDEPQREVMDSIGDMLENGWSFNDVMVNYSGVLAFERGEE